MDCCGNTFQKARTSLAMIGETFRLLPMHSTTGPAKHSRGEHRRKCLPASYTQVHDTVLRRQVESAQVADVEMMALGTQDERHADEGDGGADPGCPPPCHR